MCGRFYIEKDLGPELERVVSSFSSSVLSERTGDISPSEKAPVIDMGKEGLKVSEKTWGFPSPKGKGLIINARCESVFERPMFKSGIKNGRIIVPASGFYEWSKEKEKNRFYRGDSKILFMAGFYDIFEGEDRFVILTTKANASVKEVHSRMPLILEENELKDWTSDEKAAEEILLKTPASLKKWTEYEQLSWF